jgi:hypothetical protein
MVSEVPPRTREAWRAGWLRLAGGSGCLAALHHPTPQACGVGTRSARAGRVIGRQRGSSDDDVDRTCHRWAHVRVLQGASSAQSHDDGRARVTDSHSPPYDPKARCGVIPDNAAPFLANAPDRTATRTSFVSSYGALPSAITAHAVAAAEMNWSLPCGKPASTCRWKPNARDRTNHDPSSSCVRSRYCIPF